MMSGTYKLYLARTMLALFSDKKFDFSSGSGESDDGELDLTAHLTNTCLQVSQHHFPVNGYTADLNEIYDSPRLRAQMVRLRNSSNFTGN